ncbi:MAG: tetratricopeptide repeat protein [Planctomyces sp.]
MRCNYRKTLSRIILAAAGSVTIVGCSTGNGFVMNSSGQNYYQQGNLPAAAAEFEQAVRTDPTNPDYLANLAKVRAKMGDASGSEQLYRQALSVSPSHQPSYHGLAELMLAQGRGQEATSMMGTWVATQPYVAESHLEMAWLQRELGNSAGAAQSLQQALQVNPGHATALAHLGQYYQDVGRPDQAVAMYQQSLRADFNQPEVHSRLAAASQSAGAAHPMSATAMARGVHPYEMARQPSVLGTPSQGSQVASMQAWQQSQMAQATGAFGPYASQMPWSAPGMMAQQPNPYSPAAFAQSMPNVNGSAMPFSGDSEWKVVPGSYRVIDSGAGQQGNGTMSPATMATSTPAPTPDPAISGSVVFGNSAPSAQRPVTSVSVTSGSPPMTTSPQGLTADTSGSAQNTPVIDAF